jgi:DNA invertase Pin-like site-specific DNA recombinase
LSKEDEETGRESESIVNQKALLTEYARECGWDIYKIYCDEDYSGIDRARPQFNALIHDAQAGHFEIVLCKTQSRFTRDMELVEKYIHHDFLLWGIRFVALVDNADTEVKGNKKARQINGLVNEWYLEDLSENIKAVLDHKRKQGDFIGSFAAYGYIKDPENHNKLLPDPMAAAVVRRIFTLYLQGFGKQKITELLNKEGVANPTLYKQNLGLAYVNQSGAYAGLWNKTTVGRILQNELYTGSMVQGKRRKISYKDKTCTEIPRRDWIRVENTHEPIIEKEVFERVQDLMSLRTRAQESGEIHLLAGKVFCADCGSILSKVNSGGKGTEKAYLRCKLHAQNKALCSGHYIRLEQLTELVEAKIYVYIKEFYEKSEPIPLAKPLLNKTAVLLKAQLEKRSRALKSLYLDRAAGIIGEEQFCELNRAFLKEKQAYTERLALLKEDADFDDKSQERQQKYWRELCAFKVIDRELIALLVDKIEVWEKNKATAEQRISISWLF